ncbi:MAG: peptide ABC transporter substrate-binding protein [Proteobacteria bacterium]|nr:peptide ABC transporter substrate-binding protein [Pseudomonadota bacterium]
MTSIWRSVAVAGALATGIAGGDVALAQKSGGILKVYTIDSPASVSIHEENTVFAERPVMGVFNNLVMFDQHVRQNSLAAIVPDLAERWSWDADGLRLTVTLRQGVKWHDGKPFTAADVKCTWDLLQDKAPEKLRINPRKGWYRNLEDVTTAGDFEATFHLKRPQPAFLALLASGYSPVYPCHVPPKDMRRHPIGTGPFRFVAFKPNESIKVTRNPDYWKPGLPYLDGIEWIIIRNRSTAILAFISGKVDMTSPYGVTVQILKDVRSQMPEAICELTPGNVSRNLIVNRDKPPFDNPDLRRAMALTLDRKAFIDIITEGAGDVGGVMQPPPEGLWGMPADVLEALPSYDPDVRKNRAEARAIMARLGYGPTRRLTIKLLTRDIPPYRDPAVILIDQLKEIYIDAELEPIDTTVWFPKMMRKDYMVAMNLTGSGLDDPDQNLYAGYACGAVENYNGYCNPDIDRLIDQQSMEADPEARKQLVWAIERKLAEDDARPIIFYVRGGTCWQPAVKNLTIMVNSIYNGWRMEDVWLDR